MDDYTALAARIAGSVGELRGCLILSRDGLVLGAYPDDEEGTLKPAWLRFAQMGEPDKGFVEFGDELWAYVRRGPYAAFAVSPTTVRPGVVIDLLEQALLTAEESRTKREPLRLPEPPPAPSGKPRTSLHKDKEGKPQETSVVPAERRPTGRAEEVAPTEIAGKKKGSAAAAAEPHTKSRGKGRSEPALQPEPELAQAVRAETGDGSDGEGEIDRVLLAQEFSRLLQETGPGDEDETG